MCFDLTHAPVATAARAAATGLVSMPGMYLLRIFLQLPASPVSCLFARSVKYEDGHKSHARKRTTYQVGMYYEYSQYQIPGTWYIHIICIRTVTGYAYNRYWSKHEDIHRSGVLVNNSGRTAQQGENVERRNEGLFYIITLYWFTWHFVALPSYQSRFITLISYTPGLYIHHTARCRQVQWAWHRCPFSREAISSASPQDASMKVWNPEAGCSFLPFYHFTHCGKL